MMLRMMRMRIEFGELKLKRRTVLVQYHTNGVLFARWLLWNDGMRVVSAVTPTRCRGIRLCESNDEMNRLHSLRALVELREKLVAEEEANRRVCNLSYIV